MKMKVEALDKEWEVNTVTREQRREYHGWNNQVFADSLFEMVDTEAKLFKIVTDWRERSKLFTNVLEHAFGGTAQTRELLDEKENIPDNDQDKLAEAILQAYFNLSPKKNGE